MDELLVVGVNSSPTTTGRTDLALRAVLAGAAATGAATRYVSLTDASPAEAVAAVGAAHGVVFAGPTYRGTHNATMRRFLESVGRGEGDTDAPLQRTAALVLLTGASAHHFLAVNDLGRTLSGFFATQVLSPGLYFDHSAFDGPGAGLRPTTSETAELHGRALAELAAAVAASHHIIRLQPQA